jgi:hypothetical protein
LLNVEADEIEVTVTDPTAGVVHSETISTTDNSQVSNWWRWFFLPIVRQSNFVRLDLPSYRNATIKIEFTNTGDTVKVGEIVIGTKKHIGRLRYGYSVGFRGYATKTEDELGNPMIDPGTYYDAASFPIIIDRWLVHDIRRTFGKYKNTPLVFIGAEWATETIIYGWVDDLDIPVETLKKAYYTISIEELRTDD